jgi:two-component system, OmpR family, phosphate regulon sensor histidine kinase PhoR
MSPRPSLRRLLPISASLIVPPAGVFLALIVAGEIDLWPALAGVAAITLLSALLAGPFLHDLAKVAGYAAALARGEDASPPLVTSSLAADLLTALNQLRRAWRLQGDEKATLLGFHETVFDRLPSPLFLLNAQRRIVKGNLAARNLFGRQQTGRDLAAVLRHPDILEAADRVLAGAVGEQVDFTLPGPTDRHFGAMVEPLPQIGPDGTVALLWLHDVTTLKQLEQTRADFVANASHELRTPLAALLGFIETLRGPARDDGEARERFLQIMQEQGTRMSRLVDDLLTLSRIETHEHSRPSRRADLGTILHRVAAGLELQAAKRRMPISLEFAEPLPPVVGDEDELVQIFQNLVDNALKYGREGTPVTMTARLADQVPPAIAGLGAAFVAVAVRDRGDGIAREHLPRLTERFFRVDTARSRQMGGTGLGLAIVKHVIARHHGALAIDSTLGAGSTFTVFLPAA